MENVGASDNEGRALRFGDFEPLKLAAGGDCDSELDVAIVLHRRGSLRAIIMLDSWRVHMCPQRRQLPITPT